MRATFGKIVAAALNIAVGCTVVVLAPNSGNAESLNGIRLDAGRDEIEGLLGKPENFDQLTTDTVTGKWTTSDHNELSVTLSKITGEPVYIEKDWDGKPSDSLTSIHGVRYGSTTLNDLRAMFGSNGIGYSSNAVALSADNSSLTLNNCWQTNTSDPDQAPLYCFITRAERKDFNNIKAEKNAGAYAKVDAVILARPSFLKEIWGLQAKRAPDYQPVVVSMARGEHSDETVLTPTSKVAGAVVPVMPNLPKNICDTGSTADTIKRIIAKSGAEAFEVYDIISLPPQAGAILNMAAGRDMHMGCMAKVASDKGDKTFVYNIANRNGHYYVMGELEDAIPDQLYEMFKHAGDSQSK